MKRNLFLLLPALLLATLAHADSPRWQVLDETTSPNGRLAIAWGVPGKPAVKESIGESDDAVNYLVDLRAKRVIATLKGITHYPDRRWSGIRVRWTRDSKAAVVVQSGRFEYRGITLTDASGHQVSLGTRATADALAFLNRKGGAKLAAARKRVHGEVTIDIDSQAISPGKVTLKMSASDPKYFEYSDAVELTYTYRATSSGIRITGSKARQGKAS